MSSNDAAGNTPVNAIPIRLVAADGVDEALGALSPAQAEWARVSAFRGRLGQVLCLPDPEGRLESVLFGWGDATARARGRFHLGDFARSAPAGTYRLETALEAGEAEEAALGWQLGRYRFERYKKRTKRGEAVLVAPDGVDQARVDVQAEGVFLARDLINTPANDMGPEALEAACRDLAARHGAEIRVVAGDDLLTENMPLIHAVGCSGAQAPRLVEMLWGDVSHPKLTLVGKGVCFDTGGLDIKPASAMKLMKKDMGGAATVLGLAHMVMALGLKVRLRVLIPAVENAISASAMRPGDILRSRLGLTVEVNNTDAEGRLVLADALALGAKDAPALMLDMATLTGAARVALGPDIVPFFTDDAGLAEELAEAGSSAADPLWQLPLWPGYEAEIEPGIADLDNAPSGGMAGAITAALFLKRFIGTTNWAHFDVYAWVPKAKPGRPQGGEAQAARAILRVLEKRFGGAA